MASFAGVLIIFVCALVWFARGFPLVGFVVLAVGVVCLVLLGV